MTDSLTNPPLVSVGLPVYNGADYIGEAISSIVSQSFSDWELLIQDNASTDATEEICRRFATDDGRISYIRNPENLGGAANFNLTVDRARGRYFKWLAHDDVCGPEYLAVCVEALENDPSVVSAYPTPFDIDESGEVFGTQDVGLNLDVGTPTQRFASAMRQAHGCLPFFGLTRTDVLRQTAQLGTNPSSDRVLIAELTLWGRVLEVPADHQYLHREFDGRGFNTHLDTTDRTSWWDPKGGKDVALLLWRELGEYFAAIERAPVTSMQRLTARWYIVEWTIRNWRNLAGEMKQLLLHRVRKRRS